MHHRWITTATVLLALSLPAPGAARPAGTRTDAERAFDRYISFAEQRVQREVAPGGAFLWIDGLAPDRRVDAETRLRSGEAIVNRAGQSASTSALQVPGGLIHDWIGIVFIPGASVDEILALVQDYDRHQRYFAPQVLKSKLLSRSGDRFDVYLRLQQTDVITVVFDTRHEVDYTRIDAARAYSRSYSTSIREIDRPGDARERPLPPEQDHGFLWRLDSYWRFAAAPGGVYVQCEAISLTRDIPTGLAWLVGPFVESVPRESLEFTLRGTRAAVLANAARCSNANRNAANSSSANPSNEDGSTPGPIAPANLYDNRSNPGARSFGACAREDTLVC